MSSVVVIDMQNPNALISMAIVSQNANNPYAAFCEYIKYCIFTNVAPIMSVSEIKASVSKNFGLFLPYNILMKCLSEIENDRFISKYDHSFRRSNSKLYDTARFEAARAEYQRAEESVISALIHYVSRYDREWSTEFARGNLIRVLDKDGLAYEIFVREHAAEEAAFPLFPADNGAEEELMSDEENRTDPTLPLFPDRQFVGRFIDELLASDTPQRSYLLQVAEGLMICAGTYQMPSAEAGTASAQIKDTEFYFDTRLLLRFIGCAGEAAVTAARELVKLIQDAGGRILYYQHTLDEMDGAFEDAIRRLSYGLPPLDSEMRIYAGGKNNSALVLSAKRASLREELASAGIYLRSLPSFSENERLEFGFDRYDFQKFMQDNLPWDTHTIENDALSIWGTHMLRQGSYSEYCGTKQHLSVFVTTNSRLIEVALQYRAKRNNTRGIAKWKPNRLPVISDIRLTCRLWSPAAQSERMSLLYLTANAVAAQRPTRQYLDTVCDFATELAKASPEYAKIPLSAYFDDYVTDTLLERTKGQQDNLDIGTFASSIAELTEWRAKEEEEKTKKAEDERDRLSSQYQLQSQDIIDEAVEKGKDRMRRKKPCVILLWAVLAWPYIVTFLLAAISGGISYWQNDWSYLWLILVPVVLAVFEQLTSSHVFLRYGVKHLLPRVEKYYIEMIESGLGPASRPFRNEIVERCMQENALISKSRALLSE